MELDDLKARLSGTKAVLATGRVKAVTGLSIRVVLPGVRVGDMVRIVRRSGGFLLAEVVGFDEADALVLGLGEAQGIGPDDRVESAGGPLEVRCHGSLLGRVLDGLGRPLDGRPLPTDGELRGVLGEAPGPLSRPPIASVLPTGVRAIDGLLTLGEGQRVGLFAGAGVGKSSLLGAVARGSAADVVVVALVGERGREVGDFLEHSLGESGRKRAVVVASTSDASAVERVRAAQVATTYGEYFRDQGARVLLLLDSITRFARAQREIGLCAGEPGTRRGYPPSVFSLLPRLVERCGMAQRGSITAVYTVLVEGGDMDEPIADEMRGLLDGHVVLDRGLFARGRFPAIDVGQSLSRVMDRLVSPAHREVARQMRQLLSQYEAKRDLLLLGGYTRGIDQELDRAVALYPRIESFLTQAVSEIGLFDDTVRTMDAALK